MPDSRSSSLTALPGRRRIGPTPARIDRRAAGQYAFRTRDKAVRLRSVVRFNWEMVLNESGEVVGGGLEVLELGEDGRIATDYMFPGL